LEGHIDSFPLHITVCVTRAPRTTPSLYHATHTATQTATHTVTHTAVAV